MENKKWIIICIIGGILMFLGGVVGSVGFFATIFNYLSTWVPQLAPILSAILNIFSAIAAGGGISVIIGAIIVARGSYGSGKFIIGLGAGMGLIGLIIFLITSAVGGTIASEMEGIISGILNGSYGFVGVILTIIARMKLKEE